MLRFTHRVLPAGHLLIKAPVSWSLDDEPRDIYEALEDMTCNDSFEWVLPGETNSLTDAPILGRDVERDDHYNITAIGDLWWYPQYETHDELHELLWTKGQLIFTYAPDEEES